MEHDTLPTYTTFASTLYNTGIVDDAWLDGRPRFRLQGVILLPAQARALRRAAERVGAVYQELIALVWDHPDWLDTYFHLTPYQKLMWFAAQGRWHGIARADLFLCTDGRVQCCELNSDTPSGEAEAVLLNRLLLPYHQAVSDPNRRFPAAFWHMLLASHGGRQPGTVGIVYPTELTEDLSMIALYRTWLAAHGCQVVLGSPYNLHACAEGVGMFGRPLDLLIRHYKTDWWGERQVVWHDATPYPDAEPLAAQLELLLATDYAGRLTIVNPFGAVLSQNKLTLALMWEARQLFSGLAQRWIQRYIPKTYRMTQVSQAELLAHQQDWVLKSAYGCEGEETVCGPFVSASTWHEAVTKALPHLWVCQRFFHSAAEPQGALCNYGVYLVGGKSVGFFTRLTAAATDTTAATAPTFIATRKRL
ncbi:MAG: hypothetical protein FJZ47_25405 [Candidatus Tectomicrobia bacterium]|uniref:Glutathionylspermidine synthase pre-ATP-grasp-like domain-containing protein n=1 Tax=Tectimicrobiota bacterium TaxID=2528274 RepID=A0A937W513_UNCTE|nr:hypothetical protein [Candidatus Tectomicrobia bacterium]